MSIKLTERCIFLGGQKTNSYNCLLGCPVSQDTAGVGLVRYYPEDRRGGPECQKGGQCQVVRLLEDTEVTISEVRN